MRQMSRIIAMMLVAVLLLSACNVQGDGKPTETQPVQTTTEPVAGVTTPEEDNVPEEVYTVIFDKNTTPDDVTDDESFKYYTTGWGAQQKSSIVEIPKSDDAYIPADVVPTPTRKGYYFAGWYTKPVITEEDIVNGVSPYQVFFGEKVSVLGAMESAAVGVELENEAMYIKDFENLTDDGTVKLYARWVEAKEISTEQELREMANDLSGAYILTADITLTEEWTPIGTYFNNYTYYNDSWWVYAFRGTLDGNGHTISGLKVNGVVRNSPIDSEDPSTVWHDDGWNSNGSAGFFAAMCNANISNLTIEGAQINVAGDYAYSGDYCYAAPLACFDMYSTLKNIHIINPVINVEYSDAEMLRAKELYTSVAGLEAGGWNSSVSDCSVDGAVITLNFENVIKHGGQIFVGGMVGECFATMKNNTVNADIKVNGVDVCEATEDRAMVVNIGGLNAGNTSSSGNTVNVNLEVAVTKPVGESVMSVGGYSGAQKFMSATNNTIVADIKTEFDLDPEHGQANVGAVLGRIDPYYITLILMYANGQTCGASDNTTTVTHNGEPLTVAMPESGMVHVNGDALTYIATRDFTDAEGNTYYENADEVVEAYGSYILRSEMINDILYMNVE